MIRALAIYIVRFYQRRLRRFHNRQCIYTPSCSNYAISALEKHGFLTGCRYIYWRIKRCNGALYKGGEDYP